MTTLARQTTARMATIDAMRPTTLAAFLDPIPTNDTLHAMFARANIPRAKANPLATRGGGPVYYHVAAVEKLFRDMMMTARIGKGGAE